MFLILVNFKLQIDQKLIKTFYWQSIAIDKNISKKEKLMETWKQRELGLPSTRPPVYQTHFGRLHLWV
jgi:hypothetical protein